MIDDEYATQLSEYCFNLCETLKGALHGRNPCDLSEPEKIGVQTLEKCVG